MSKRDWSDARAKVESEGRCRVCGDGGSLQAAHTIGRKHDDKNTGYVHPDDIVPLCINCHQAYDNRRLPILAHMTLVEQARAVGHVGIVSAYRRLGSQRPPS